MTGSEDLWVVVPARRGSTRFPNKALAEIDGAPMIAHVVARVREALPERQARVIVATDCPDIATAVEGRCEVVLQTALEARTGTDRVAATCASLAAWSGGVTPRWVVNVQGDQPCLPAAALRAIVARRLGSAAPIVTAAVPMRAPARFLDPDVVKVALDSAGRALMFSRAPIPHGAVRWHWHVGVYALTWDALARFAALPTGRLEACERLEQLRALEAGMAIEVAELDAYEDAMWPSVDRPDDVGAARGHLKRRGEPAMS